MKEITEVKIGVDSQVVIQITSLNGIKKILYLSRDLQKVSST